AAVDFTGQEPGGKCPKWGNRVFETAMHYVCEKATGPNRTCDFRSGKIILQRPIERAQMQKLFETGKNDLLGKVILCKWRPFKGYVVVKDKGLAFEFEPRQGKPRAAKSSEPKTPAPKLDFTGQEPLGKCPKCGGKIFESESGFLCERTQADKKA